MTRKFLVVPIAAAALGIGASVAHANIVVGKSIHGVALGQTKAQVAKILHVSKKIQKTNDWSPGTIRVHFSKGRVDHLLYARDKGDKTSKGIGLGSTREQLKTAYPNATCGPGPYGEGSENCVVSGKARGKRSYTGFLFQTADGGVVEINTGFGNSGL